MQVITTYTVRKSITVWLNCEVGLDSNKQVTSVVTFNISNSTKSKLTEQEVIRTVILLLTK